MMDFQVNTLLETKSHLIGLICLLSLIIVSSNRGRIRNNCYRTIGTRDFLHMITDRTTEASKNNEPEEQVLSMADLPQRRVRYTAQDVQETANYEDSVIANEIQLELAETRLQTLVQQTIQSELEFIDGEAEDLNPHAPPILTVEELQLRQHHFVERAERARAIHQAFTENYTQCENLENSRISQDRRRTVQLLETRLDKSDIHIQNWFQKIVEQRAHRESRMQTAQNETEEKRDSELEQEIRILKQREWLHKQRAEELCAIERQRGCCFQSFVNTTQSEIAKARKKANTRYLNQMYHTSAISSLRDGYSRREQQVIRLSQSDHLEQIQQLEQQAAQMRSVNTELITSIAGLTLQADNRKMFEEQYKARLDTLIPITTSLAVTTSSLEDQVAQLKKANLKLEQESRLTTNFIERSERAETGSGSATSTVQNDFANNSD